MMKSTNLVLFLLISNGWTTAENCLPHRGMFQITYEIKVCSFGCCGTCYYRECCSTLFTYQFINQSLCENNYSAQPYRIRILPLISILVILIVVFIYYYSFCTKQSSLDATSKSVIAKPVTHVTEKPPLSPPSYTTTMHNSSSISVSHVAPQIIITKE